jgi:sugar diacid utilization regulator
MTAVADRPRRERVAHHDHEPPDAELTGAALAALTELTAAVSGRADVRESLRRLSARVCEVLEIERCAVYVRDDPREVYVGCTSHPVGELEAEVRRLVLGGVTDRITREIVRDRAPLLIRDAASDPRALTSAVRSHKVRSLLGVPMMSEGAVLGVMMLDNGPELHRYAPRDIEIATAFATLGATMIALSRESIEVRSALETATRQNRLLRRTAVAEHRLSDAVLGGGGLGAIVDLVSSLTGKPATLYDRHGQVVATGVPDECGLAVTLLQDAAGDETVRALLDEVVPGASVTVQPSAGAAVRRRHLAAPVDVSGERWGWLVLMEHPARLAAFDDFLIRRAATHLALELAGRRQMLASSADARALLARQLVRGTTVEDDLRRHAEYLGVAVDAHRIVAYFNAEPGSVDTAALVEALRARSGADVLVTSGPEGIALLVEVPETEIASRAVRRTKHSLGEALGTVSTGRRLAGISAVCRCPADLPGGYRMAVQVARCLESFPQGDGHRVLAADDLGPGRLFVANGHPEEMQRFVDDVLGRLLAGDDAGADLMRTLEAFYDTGRSVRLASEKLGVHENTVRYRLSRVQAITGLDVGGDADDQLSVQVALLVLRLQGHPCLRPFDAAQDAPPALPTQAL